MENQDTRTFSIKDPPHPGLRTQTDEPVSSVSTISEPSWLEFLCTAGLLYCAAVLIRKSIEIVMSLLTNIAERYIQEQG
jgi:hypothetical protein